MSNSQNVMSAQQARTLLQAGREFQKTKDYEMAWAYYDQAIQCFQRLSMEKELEEARKISQECLEQVERERSRQQTRPTSARMSRTSEVELQNVNSTPVVVSTPIPTAEPSTTSYPQTREEYDSLVKRFISSLRPWTTEFFNFSQFSVPLNSETSPRISANIAYFKNNYFAIFLLVLLYFIFTSSVLFWLALALVAVLILTKSKRVENIPQMRDVRTKYESLEPKYRVPIVILTGLFVLYLVIESLGPILFAVGTTIFFVLIHGAFHEPPRTVLVEEEIPREPTNPQQQQQQQQQQKQQKQVPSEITCCSICLEQKPNAVFVPCGHICCFSCGDQIFKSTKVCPFCKSSIQNLHHFYV